MTTRPRGAGPLAFGLTFLFLLAGARAGLGPGHCPRHEAQGAGTPAATDAHRPGHAQPPPDDPHAACTCLDACHAAASTPLSGTPVATVAVAVPRGRFRVSDEAQAARRAPTPHLLPLANGPPARV